MAGSSGSPGAHRPASAASFSSTSSAIDSWSSSREPALQTWPELPKIPSAAWATARSTSGDVVEDHVGRLAAALELDALHVRLARVDEEQLPDLARAGEGELVDVHVAAERLTGGLAEPGEDVEHAVRHARLGGQLRERERDDRRLLRGLEDDRVAGRQRRAELPGRHQDRVVPRHHQPDDADRLARDERERGGPGRADLAVDLVDRLGEVAEVRRRAVDLALGAADRLAHVERDHQREPVAVALDQVGEPEQDGPALARRDPRPGARLEGAPGDGHRAIDVLAVARGDVEQRLAADRAHAREGRAGGGVDELAVDERLTAEPAGVGERAAPGCDGGHAAMMTRRIRARAGARAGSVAAPCPPRRIPITRSAG